MEGTKKNSANLPKVPSAPSNPNQSITTKSHSPNTKQNFGAINQSESASSRTSPIRSKTVPQNVKEETGSKSDTPKPVMKVLKETNPTNKNPKIATSSLSESPGEQHPKIKKPLSQLEEKSINQTDNEPNQLKHSHDSIESESSQSSSPKKPVRLKKRKTTKTESSLAVVTQLERISKTGINCFKASV